MFGWCWGGALQGLGPAKGGLLGWESMTDVLAKRKYYNEMGMNDRVHWFAPLTFDEHSFPTTVNFLSELANPTQSQRYATEISTGE